MGDAAALAAAEDDYYDDMENSDSPYGHTEPSEKERNEKGDGDRGSSNPRNGYDESAGVSTETIAHKTMNFLLRVFGAETQLLSDIININNLSNVINTNSSALDPATQAMINTMTRHQIEEYLRTVRVMSNVNIRVYNFITGLFKIEPNGVASAIGNNIYDRGANFVNEINKGGSFAESSANLLGHETIHTLQSRAYRGISSFAKVYNNGSSYYANKFEVAAYSFGPNNSKARKFLADEYNSKKGGSTILSRKPGWWR